jgi:hypothetical protein
VMRRIIGYARNTGVRRLYHVSRCNPLPDRSPAATLFPTHMWSVLTAFSS